MGNLEYTHLFFWQLEMNPIMLEKAALFSLILALQSSEVQTS